MAAEVGVVAAKAWQDVSGEAMMANALSFGPLVASVNAESWQLYTGGHTYDRNNTSAASAAGEGVVTCNPIAASACPSAPLNHVVSVVGYWLGKGGDVEEWVARNHWGEKWGCKGMAYLTAGEDTCGVEDDVFDVGI